MSKQVLLVHDNDGKLVAVQISPELWQKVQPLLEKEEKTNQNDLEGFRGFLDAWSFPYPYKAEVICPVCKRQTEDWREDGAFRLANANIGGILVFHCNGCGATVRQKYFKTHMDCDFTPPAQ